MAWRRLRCLQPEPAQHIRAVLVAGLLPDFISQDRVFGHAGLSHCIERSASTPSHEPDEGRVVGTHRNPVSEREASMEPTRPPQ